ncbi:MAG: phosphoribosyltransferase family protein [Adlercreutzia equolifaciens]
MEEIEGVKVPWASWTSASIATTSTHMSPSPFHRIPFSIDGMTIVLVDDVLYTGRTIRAALTPSWTSAAPPPWSWRSSSTAAIASCPSAPTSWARTSPRPPARTCACSWRKSTASRPWRFWTSSRASAQAPLP